MKTKLDTAAKPAAGAKPGAKTGSTKSASKSNASWFIRITLISMAISMTFTFASSRILGSTGYVMAFLVLALFIFVGVLFDLVGVAVTAAESKPFHAMAANKVGGASQALRLIKNAEKVSSVCNDVFGDISGIVSGSTAALIVAKLNADIHTSSIFFDLGAAALVTGLTVGGKAVGKTLAMSKSTAVVLEVGKLINLIDKVFRKK